MTGNGTNGSSAFLKWWPVIVFFLIQTAAAGAMYGDVRARLVSIEGAQSTFLTRKEADLMLKDADRVHNELRKEIERRIR